MKNQALFTSNKKDWETPQELFDQLDRVFHFDLDAAASEQNHKCANYFTEETDGLTAKWGGGNVFCNPPYGSKETGEWTRKCYEEALNGASVVLLIPARTDRRSFHEYIWGKQGVDIEFIRGRLKFEVAGVSTEAAPFPSMLVFFNCDKEDVEMVKNVLRV